jgi:hypothetical protein
LVTRDDRFAFLKFKPNPVSPDLRAKLGDELA